MSQIICYKLYENIKKTATVLATDFVQQLTMLKACLPCIQKQAMSHCSAHQPIGMPSFVVPKSGFSHGKARVKLSVGSSYIKGIFSCKKKKKYIYIYIHLSKK